MLSKELHDYTDNILKHLDLRRRLIENLAKDLEETSETCEQFDEEWHFETFRLTVTEFFEDMVKLSKEKGIKYGPERQD